MEVVAVDVGVAVVAVAVADMATPARIARGSVIRVTSNASSVTNTGTNRCPVEKKGEEAHCVKAEDKEPTVLLAETATPGLLEHPPRSNIQRMFLNEARIVPELHLTGGGDPTGDVWYLDNGASNHKTID